MDTARTGALTLDQFKEYLARENPRSIKRAHDIFLTMKSGSQQDSSGEDASLEPRVTFIEVRNMAALCLANSRPIIDWQSFKCFHVDLCADCDRQQNDRAI